MQERRTAPRKQFDFYLTVMDDSREILGRLVEVSALGFQLDSSAPHPAEKDCYLRV
jgi:hypothetical protein